MLILRYIIDLISLIFVTAFVYLIILWGVFEESIPQHFFYILEIVFWILLVWMVVVTLIGTSKMIFFYSYIFRRVIKKIL